MMASSSSSSETWSCFKCTFENSPHRNDCEICQAPRPIGNFSGKIGIRRFPTDRTKKKQKSEEQKDNKNVNGDLTKIVEEVEDDDDTKGWDCYRCSYKNDGQTRKCYICEAPKLGVGTANSSTASGDQSPNRTWPCENCNVPISVSCLTCSSCQLRKRHWNCPQCTLQNDIGKAKCTACSAINPTRPKPPLLNTKRTAQESKSSSSNWNCTNCSKSNSPDATKCFVCGSPKVNNNVSRKKPESPLPKQLERQHSSFMEDLRRLDEQNARDAFERIVNFCEVNKQNFVDDSFAPVPKSIGDLSGNDGPPSNLRVQNMDYSWLRPHQIRTRDGQRFRWAVFRDAKPTDIQQGVLGNCWFLVALAVISERTELLERILITKDYCKFGVYQIRLCIDGHWRVILVNDHFPCHSNGFLAFSEGRRNQLWVPLIEKALAKIHGNYGALNAGRSVEGLAILTGAPCEVLSLEPSARDPNDSATEDEMYSQDMIWVRLLSSFEAGFLMGCSCGAGTRQVCEREYERVGLRPRHAYSVLDVKEVNGHRLIRVRNPWGQYVWNGLWSDASDLWTPQLRTQLMPNGPLAGVFWMPFQSFCEYFDSVDICKVRKDWNEKRVPVLFPPHALKSHFRITRLTVVETTEIDLTLYQQGHRMEPNDKKHAQLDLLIIVVKEGHGDGKIGQYISTSGRKIVSSLSCHHVFTPGVYVILCIAFNHWGMQLRNRDIPDGLLSLHSAKQMVVERLITNPTALADVLIQLSIHKGICKPSGLPGITTYYMSRGYGGLILVLENATNDLFLQVSCDCTNSENITSSRGSLVLFDCIPPLHRQVLVVLSHCEFTQNYAVVHKLTYVTSPYSGLGRFLPDNPRELHQPVISDSTHGLHFPRPLFS